MNTVEDLWMKIEKQAGDNLNKENTIETTLLIVGEPSSGKSSLIQSFLKPTVTKEPKSTIALDYSYAKKKAPAIGNVNQNVTSLCHIWELGGEVNESKLLEIPLTKTTLSSSTILIVCDLSKPQNILVSLQKWIKVTRELIKKQISEYRLANNNAKFLSKINSQSLTASAYQDHPKDSSRARPCEIPIYIVLNKYDLFKITPTTDKRAVYQVVRMFAHYHGAHVITTSVVENTLKDTFRTQMNLICFPPTPPPVVAVTPSPAPTSTATATVNTTTTEEKEKDKENNVTNTTTTTTTTSTMTATATPAAKTTKTYYDVNIEKPTQVSAGRDDFETILLLSLPSTAASGSKSAASAAAASDDAKVAKSRLLTAESDVAAFLTPQGVSTDCWNKFNEHVSLTACEERIEYTIYIYIIHYYYSFSF